MPLNTEIPRIARVIERVEVQENKTAILSYFNRCLARGLSPYGVRKNLYCLTKISELMAIPFNKAQREDIEGAMAYIENNSYAENTKNLFRATLKAFYGKGDPRVSWIKVRGRIITRKLPQELITREELHYLISKTGNKEKKALLMFLYDSAIRPSEFIALRQEHIVLDEQGMFVMIPGMKTPQRTIYLVESRKYLDNIPFGKYSYSGMKNIFDRVKIHINKRFYPYILRHSRLTELARWGWNESMLCSFAGWVQGSVMSQVYIHLNEQDLKNRMLATMKK